MHIHTFIPSDKKDYEICTECGSYHSTAQVSPEVLYVETPYWGDGTGRSTLEQQVENFNCIDDCGISKADRIMQFVPKGKTVVEIAAAPGELLRRLSEFGYEEVYGIEPSMRYVDFIARQAPKAMVINGFFPQVFSEYAENVFDCIIGVDVMEHTDDYDFFFKSVYRLLNPGGTAVIMSPIILNEDGLYRQRDFDFPDQHCWVHTQKGLQPYLEETFSSVNFFRWIVGHEGIKLVK